MDINQFRTDFWKSWNKGVAGERKGQHLFNCARRVDMDIAPDFMTEDPYYNDANIDRFFAYLEKRWNTG